jgi:hypothetical protein
VQGYNNKRHKKGLAFDQNIDLSNRPRLFSLSMKVAAEMEMFNYHLFLVLFSMFVINVSDCRKF